MSISTPEQVIKDFEDFCFEWTDKARIKETVLEFKKWEERNPIENRRTNGINFGKDPVPSNVCFSIPKNVVNFILENY